MSAHDDEIEKARESRRRAEEVLKEVRAQQPQIKDLSDRAAWLRVQNSFSSLIIQTVGSRT